MISHNTPSHSDLATILELAMKLASQAAALITDYRRESSYRISFKSDRNLVTSADLAAEKIILEGIRSRFPSHAILSEESSPDLAADSEALWIVDPIDGTTNYARGHVHVGVSIAYAVRGEVQAGVVAAPFLNETYHAARGGGAFLNGNPIHVTNATSLSRALIATGFPYERDCCEALGKRVQTILASCADIRRAGACSLDVCWVAAGKLDGYIETVNPWDMAAGALIAREAGAIVSNLGLPLDAGRELCGDRLLVSAPGIHAALRELLAGHS